MKMISKMNVTNKVSCGVRMSVEKVATAVHLFAEEQVQTWWCCKKMVFTPIMCITLDNKRRHRITDALFEYPDCRVKVNFEKIRELDANCYVKLKVKLGEMTIRKIIINAKHLIQCLQEPSNMFAKIHVDLDVFSFYPLTAGLKILTKKAKSPVNKTIVAEVEAAADETRTTVAEATGDQSLPAVSDTITNQPLQTIPVACEENLIMENTSEVETDEEWEDIPSSGDDEGELKQDDGDEGETYPRQESQNISCSEGVGMNEEQTTQSSVEAAPLWVRMWRPARKVVQLSVFGLLAVTAVLVVLEPMLPGLDDDEL